MYRQPQLRIKIIIAIVDILILLLVPLFMNEASKRFNLSDSAFLGLGIIIAILIISSNVIVIKRSFAAFRQKSSPLPANLGDVTCGDDPLDLGRQRLFISSALGTYFTSLLESPNPYLILPGQLETAIPENLTGLPPIERIIAGLIETQGIYIVVIAADGGMGKSTLAARIARCLHGRDHFKWLLGDSAKTEVVDLFTEKTQPVTPGFIDPESFLQKLSSQLGLSDDIARQVHDPRFIRNHLLPDTALVIIDNLETVSRSDKLLKMLPNLVNENIRAIITTRSWHGSQVLPHTLVVHLRPLIDPARVIDFLKWHIDSFAHIDPRLKDLRSTLNRSHAELLIQKSGGVPLVMQLLVPYVMTYTWDYLRQVPNIPLTKELLDYLYLSRWQELKSLNMAGQRALQILQYLAIRQQSGQHTNLKQLQDDLNKDGLLLEALLLLSDRFLVINRDLNHGDYILFPSLMDFVFTQHEQGSKG